MITFKTIIMMATYNGEKFIEQQLDSIIEQTEADWHLIVCDDGSNDNTINVIKKYQVNDSRIDIITNKLNVHGSVENFYYLMDFVKKNYMANYYFFADQDDIWNKEKLEKQIKEMQKLESKNIPVVVYSDSELIDHSGMPYGKKLSDFRDISLNNQLDIFFDRIHVWGNTEAFNDCLLQMMRIPVGDKGACSHDQYTTFYAAAFGRVIYMDEPLTLYRRYDNNVSALPEKYNLYTACTKAVNKYHEIIRKHLSSYDQLKYFINGISEKTEFLVNLEMLVNRGGLYLLKFKFKYKVSMGSNLYNKVANWFVLLFVV